MVLATLAVAQTPDARIRADLLLHYHSPADRRPTLRWYDPFGNYSRISLDLTLEPGFRVYVSERLQKIDGNADEEQLDQYYIEDPSLWRLGKQYLPFGTGLIVRESVIAARGDSMLLFGGLPVSGAVFDGGDGRARGVTVRVGRRVGVSAMVGEFLGAQSTTRTSVQRPEEAPGRNRGHRLLVGADFARKAGRWQVAGELVLFRDGQQPRDRDTEVSDLTLTYPLAKGREIQFGWSREWRDRDNFFRAQGRLELVRNVWAEPFVRTRNGSIMDGGVSLRVRF